MKVTDGLAQKAKFLKNAAPREFEEFEKELAAYSDLVLRGVVAAPSDEILVAQGNAQMLLQVQLILRECDKQRNQPTT